MKLQVIETYEKVSKKTGEVTYCIGASGRFADYGTVKTKIVEIIVDQETYTKMSNQVGKEVDLDIIIPLPDFPLRLKPKGD